MPHVVFLCASNAGASQIAEAYLRRLAQNRAEVESAGLEPAADLDPVVVTAMREAGVPVEGQKPKKWDPARLHEGDRIVAIGLKPLPPRTTDDWAIADPVGKSLDEVRKIRDQIRARVDILATDLNVSRPGTAILKPGEG